MSAGKLAMWGVVLAVVVGLGAGVWWYVSVPHTAEAQFAVAQKLETALNADALTKTATDLGPQIEAAIEQYRRVGSRFGKSAKAAEALKRIAAIEERVGKDASKAMAALDELARDYPDETNGGFALMEEARLIRADADKLKGDKQPEAKGRYMEALAKLEAYRKQFAKGKGADGALMEMGRIWQDGLEEPLIRSIETYEQFLKEYPEATNPNRAEALYRLAKAYDRAKEFAHAMELYARLLEEFPGSKWESEAIMARGRILGEQMAQHDEAAKEFEKVPQESPLRGSAQAEARDERGKAASAAGEQYGKSRYGGSMPQDTVWDKPLPPSEMIKEYAEQKLDAEEYDLNVDFVPAEHRITVNGTLKLANGGAEKTELLLMLGSGMKVTRLTVDEVVTSGSHMGEAWRIKLPQPMKPSAERRVGFAYTGQYADPADMVKIMAAMGGGLPGMGTRPATRAAASMSSRGVAATSASGPATSHPAGPTYTFNPQMGLGEFGYGLSGAAWYPITFIGDVFAAHVTMHTPAGMEAVSNGAVVRREKSTQAGMPGVFEFKTHTPVFGIYFAYGPYVVQEKQVGPIDYYTYLRAADAGKHEAYVAVTDRILAFYASKFDGYPYEKMAVVETPLPPFLGGVGPASMMLLQETMVAHQDVPENLLAHELAHQWFGNYIPIAIAEPGYSQWMSEGFATYCDALYTEHMEGPKALALHIQKYGQLFFQLWMSAPAGAGAIKTTYDMRSPLYRPVIYEKGAIVLHMLRKVMGDEKFFALMRQFVETYHDKPTTVDDFRRMASATAGQDLSWFFAEWIDQSVFAHWKVDVVVGGPAPGSATGPAGPPSPAPEGAGVRVAIKVTQPDALVKMPVDITLIGAKGERQVLAMQMLDKKEQTVEATAAFRPVKVVLDEDYWVLRHPGSDNIWPSEKATGAD